MLLLNSRLGYSKRGYAVSFLVSTGCACFCKTVYKTDVVVEMIMWQNLKVN